jgi:cyclophilin family peptidyl-prolyl cis-trans isomerase
MKQFAVFAALLVFLQAQSTSKDEPKEPRGAEPLIVLNAERAWLGPDALWSALEKAPTATGREAAIRAIGRLEDPAQVLPLMARAESATATAIAQSLQGYDPATDPRLLATVVEWMRVKAGGESATSAMAAPAVAALAPAMSRIAYAHASQVGDVETMLSELAGNTAQDPERGALYLSALKGLESLARTNTKLVAFDKKTVERLGNTVRNLATNDRPSARRYAFLALVAARALDPAIERKALADDDDWQLRRAAMAVLAGAGGGLDADTRIILIREGLKDESPHVRYEAVRAYARHAAPSQGCGPLLDALRDDDTGVAIEALDRLGDACREDGDVTTRLNAEAQVPPSNQYWHRPTHAFVSLSKRSPEAAAIAMEAFVTHPVWWVRMYSAFAAAAAKDLLHLNKLAYDDNDNVREAALGHLRRLDKDAAERATLAALERSDAQLVRAAAVALKESTPRPTLYKPLLYALQRLTKDGRMTSRDARLALLQAIEQHARPEDHMDLAPFLRDFDPKVADAAAAVLTHLGKAVKADPQPRPHVPSQPFDDLLRCVSVDMAQGKAFRSRLDPASAPIASEQFLKLATVEKYYNGLTFHRVVPNFVIQGGSPGANEYSGAKDYWRDEIAAPNVRGTVGLSTRGRNTGDAQIFINLIDNARLDGQYTVFASVLPDDMDTVDRIQEGDVIRSIDMTSCPTNRRQ